MAIVLKRIEDIIEIVGLSNYVASLQLDKELLKYQGYSINARKQIVLKFDYETNFLDLIIDGSRTIQYPRCSCTVFKNDFCPHTALALQYIFTQEGILEDALEALHYEYDPAFNKKVFALKEKKEKIPVFLDVLLCKERGFSYSVQLKIGSTKKYVLKNKWGEFFEAYQKGSGMVVLGSSFTYEPEIHTFTKADQKILDFLLAYQELETNSFSYRPSFSNSSLLKETALKQFLPLFGKKQITIKEGYQEITFLGLHPLLIPIVIKEGEKQVTISFDFPKLEPLTSDYRYVIAENDLCFVEEDVADYLKLMKEENRKSLVFTSSEYSKLIRLLFPIFLKLCPDLSLEETSFSKEPMIPRFYFSKTNKGIEAKIMVVGNGEEKSIFTSDCLFNDSYFCRNQDLEEEWMSLLETEGFVKDRDHSTFLLEEGPQMFSFLDQGLRILGEKQEVYVTEELKKIKIWKRNSVESSFKIGKDHLLSVHFKVDEIPQQELAAFLHSVTLKKKYHRLKSGDYVTLDQLAFEDLSQVVKELNFTNADYLKEEVIFPSYKAIGLALQLEGQSSLAIPSLDLFKQELDHYQDCHLPSNLDDQKVLRDYQQIGVKWLWTLSHLGFGGILADEMGLGKSLQAIKYMKWRFLEENTRQFLMIVPTSLVYNWEAELKKFEPDLPYLIVHGTKNHRLEALEKVKDATVVITSYGSYRQDFSFYEGYSFDTCFLDEAQTIKNVSSFITRSVKQMKATVKFALTGTPIENSALELWSIFDFIMPGYLCHLTEFKQRYQSKISYLEHETLKELNQKIAPFLLRRKKQEVLKDLPAKLENQILVELSEEQKKLYLAQVENVKKELAEGDIAKKQILLLSLLTKLRQICIDPRLFLEGNWVGKKLETALEVITASRQNGHKMLLFSQFPSALKLLIPLLEEQGISFYYLDGATKSEERMRLVNAFNENETTVFLISLKAGGTGLNLIGADVVIHLDPWWNPQVENQATDRSHRIGQTKVVEVIKLIAKGTIEEKIVELQKKKKILSEELIDQGSGDNLFLNKITLDDLKELLSL